MESGHDTGSGVDLKTSPTTNVGESGQFISGKKPGLSSSPSTSELASQDHSHPLLDANNNTTNHGSTSSPTQDQTYLQSELHHTSSVTEKGDGSTINSHLEAHPANPYVGAHPSPLANNLAPSSSSSSSSSSQNPFLLPSDTANTTHVGATATISEKVHNQEPFEPGLHQSFSIMQHGNEGTENSSVSTHPAGSLGEAHHSSTGEMLGLHSSLAPSACESSLGNPFEMPTSTTSNTSNDNTAFSQKVDENQDHGHESHQTLPAMDQGDGSMPSRDSRTHNASTLGETHVSSSNQQLDPLFALESAQNQQLADSAEKNHEGADVPKNVESHHAFSGTEQGHQSIAADKKLGSSVSSFSPSSESSTQEPSHNSVNAANNSQTGTNAPPNLETKSQLASESSDDDIPISSMPKHEQQSSDVAGQYSSVAVVPSTNNGSEIQSSPVQVMGCPEDPANSSMYKIPSHVFARNNTNAQWSNESLFSIQMGNMSFTSDMAWLSKSGELDKHGDMYMSGAFPGNHPPLPPPPQPQPPVNKFNDISKKTAEQHQGTRVTEEKAAETMREVIMEDSMKKGGSIAEGATSSNKLSKSINHSLHSDGSTQSFAFKVFTDVDKTLPSERLEEKRKPHKQSEQQSIKETPNAAQTPKSTPNASQKKWLSCFKCCP